MYNRETKIKGGKNKKKNICTFAKNETHVYFAHGHLHPLKPWAFSIQFSLYFGEKTFWWDQWENIWAPPIFFLLFLQPNTHQKYYLLYFPSSLKSSQPNRFEEQLYLYKWLDISLITHDDDKNFGKFTKKYNYCDNWYDGYDITLYK